jgi:hypothetical protein
MFLTFGRDGSTSVERRREMIERTARSSDR